MQIRNCSNLKELLQQRASSDPDHITYSFLEEDISVSREISLGQLDLRARAIAGFLQSCTQPGDRILLVFPFGSGFLEGFWGAIYAGRIPVPVHTPRQGRASHTLEAICNDALPAIALTCREQLPRIKQILANTLRSPELHCCCVEDVLDDAAGNWVDPDVGPGAIAFLQYTSGSTATPKGVIVSHGNIVRNEQMIQDAFGESESSIVVSWLPLYHDMGLIGAVLQPLWTGSRCFLMSPQTFAQNPFQWLHAITRFHATTSGGPDFAYRLCTNRISAEQLAGLDLRSWQVAFNGSEPVRAETMRQFAEKFGPCGFRKSAFVPCYGLAESTLLVTARRKRTEPAVTSFQGSELERNSAVPCGENDPGARSLVGCGDGDPRQDIAIVNPECGTLCSTGEIGEIWLAGPHVTEGYWNKSEATAEIFGKTVAGKDGAYLRTGDLGFMLDGELFITGRIRDLIVLRGRNFYPQDFEITASQSNEAFHSGLCAAFTIHTANEPELIIVQETQSGSLDFEAACQAIREAIVAEYDVSPSKIVFVRFGTLARTSSGKIKRQECKTTFLANELKIIFQESGEIASAREETLLFANDTVAGGEVRDRHSPDAFLAGLLRRILQLGSREIAPDISLLALGLDSIGAAELKSAIAHDLKVDVPLESILQGISLAELSALVSEQGQGHRVHDLEIVSPSSSTYPLSQGQLAIWYLSRLSPDSAAYNIPVAVQCSRDIDVQLLKESFAVLARRHEALRTVIRTSHDGPYQLVLEQPKVSFTAEKTENLSDALLQDRLSEAAKYPFDLEEGPLFRISVFQTSNTAQVVLFVFHHLIVDFLSLELLLGELGSVYQALSRGESYTFAAEPAPYQRYVQWHRQMLAGGQGSELKHFWHLQLHGELAVTEMPFSRVRPAIQSYRGEACRFKIDGPIAKLAADRAKTLGISLFSLLLATFEILVHRYTGQPELTVGTPVLGRLSSRWDQTVGLFINQIVLRGKLAGEMRAEDFLRKTHQDVAVCLAHQEFPFSLLVEQLQPRRDPSHSPLFQIMFSFYRARQPEHKGLEAFLLGIPGVELQAGGLRFTSIAFDNRTAQLDLNLCLAEMDGELYGNLQWNADVFDADSISDVTRHYATLLEAVAGNPAARLSELPLVKPEEITWTGDQAEPAMPHGHAECVQELVLAQAAARPSATALVAGQVTMTYAELCAQAGALAACLRVEGVGPDVPVAILASRSAMLLTGMLGVLFAGGAFVPIDPALPAERAALMIAESGALILLTEERLVSGLPGTGAKVICLDQEHFDAEAPSKLNYPISKENLAYILFTSGSTGKPKGVMISHSNLAGFCAAMDRQISCGPGDTFVATTSISFDISILELLWPLTRGAQVRVLPEEFRFGSPVRTNGKFGKEMDFSVFYFSSVDNPQDPNKYKLMIEGAKYADRNGFSAVWTPERHFHEFGGIFPNPSVTSAAIAAITKRIGIRAGSVVLPLHDPIRVAEEWSVVDNLSQGRIGMALASGWHADDFAFFPDRYESRKEFFYRNIGTLRQLWKGETISVQSGSGKTIKVRIYPKPIQPELPIWITAAGTAETFIRAGEIGANILTHLLGQSVEQLGINLRGYRESRKKHGHDPETGQVTLMLHTFIGPDLQSVRDQVRAPFTNYLKSSVDLIANLVRSAGLNLNLSNLSAKDLDDLLSFAFDRYFDTSALFGTVRTCKAMVKSLQEIGVTEIGCLIDFGVEPAAALASLNEVRDLMGDSRPVKLQSSAGGGPKSRTILQCTPSLGRILVSDAGNREFVGSLNTLLLGGESLPSDLAAEILTIAPNCEIHNMYGPTETTIWSSSHPVREPEHLIPIGRAIANSTIHILDDYRQPVPASVPGEIYIGGDGVARGYVNAPAATAEKFVPDPFSNRPGMRLYRTGDLGRYRRDGRIEFLGRNDSQIKLRGFRIELSEIEMALATHPDVRQCVVSLRDTGNTKSLVAHFTANKAKQLKADELRGFLRDILPEYMVPAQFISLAEMPLSTSGKIDRKKLPDVEKVRPLLEARLIAPRDEIEGVIAGIWKRVLRIPELGIDDNFFDLGGHSLLMVQVHQQIQEQLQITVPLIKLLEHSTVRAFASYVRGTTQNEPAPDVEDRASKAARAMMLQRENAARARTTA